MSGPKGTERGGAERGPGDVPKSRRLRGYPSSGPLPNDLAVPPDAVSVDELLAVDPTPPAEVAVSAESGEVAGPTGPAEIAGPTGPAEIAEPAGPAEVAVSAERGEVAEPAGPAPAARRGWLARLRRSA
jgi:hypothetical protein